MYLWLTGTLGSNLDCDVNSHQVSVHPLLHESDVITVTILSRPVRHGRKSTVFPTAKPDKPTVRRKARCMVASQEDTMYSFYID